MKIAIRPLKGDTFHIEAELTEIVSAVKAKIATANQQFPADQQKLIYSGRILADEQPLSAYGIKENEFIVCMATKKPPAPAAEIAPAAAAQEPAAAHAAPAGADVTSTTTAPATTSGGFADPERVQQLVALGFPEDRVVRCLEAALGNQLLAAEYLFSDGPPATAERSASGGVTPFPAMPTGEADGLDADDDDGDEDADPVAEVFLQAFDDLQNHPRFEELSRLVIQNPAMLPQVVQAIEQTHPEFAAVIMDNQEEFLNMLRETMDGGDEDDGPLDLEVTEEDREAVLRLCQLGFSEERALEAYLACDRNEEIAANYLFDMGEM